MPIALGIEQLLKCNEDVFDVIIIGSGYGGAVSAYKLANAYDGKRKLRVAVLERGQEFEAGQFPETTEEMVTQASFTVMHTGKTIGFKEGLYDIRVGEVMSIPLANGVGGGSLVNAGVLDKPHEKAFESMTWPKDVSYSEMTRYFREASDLLGIKASSGFNTIQCHDRHSQVDKYKNLQQLAPNGKFRSAPISIAMQEEENRFGYHYSECQLCGNCATGCNYNAKKSLDKNLLFASVKRGVEIYSGVTVLSLHKMEENYEISCRYTNDRLQLRHGKPFKIKSKKVILAAGSLGSTEILLRSVQNGLEVANHSALGTSFSGNGDTIAAIYDQNESVNAIADDDLPGPKLKSIGPTITGIIDLSKEQGTIIQEIAIPRPLGHFFKEVLATSHTINQLSKRDLSKHDSGRVKHDNFHVDAEACSKTAIIAAMFDDGAQGKLTLCKKSKPFQADETSNFAIEPDFQDRRITVNWPNYNTSPGFTEVLSLLQKLTKSSGLKGDVLANPLWKAVPDDLSFLINDFRGPTLSVHPLGGLPMADSGRKGVVNQYGQVYKSYVDVYNDLLVIDGSIIPSAIGTNPALTIAAVSLRAIENNIKQWGYHVGNTADKKISTEKQHSVNDQVRFSLNKTTARQKKPTEIKLSERMINQDAWDINGKKYDIVLLLKTKAFPLQEFFKEPIPLQEKYCQLKIISESTAKKLSKLHINTQAYEDILENEASSLGIKSGKINIFVRGETCGIRRTAKSLRSWFKHRGLRDIYMELLPCDHDKQNAATFSLSKIIQRAKSTLALASKAGEVRQIRYEMEFDNTSPLTDIKSEHDFLWQELEACTIFKGVKEITYNYGANLVKQLTELHIQEGFLSGAASEQNTLMYDSLFATNNDTPLLEIVEQNDGVDALKDLASAFMYTFRMLIQIHSWSLRKPDTPKRRDPKRLPEKVKGLPNPLQIKVNVDQKTDLGEGFITLTNYRNADKPPIILIHGYSTCGVMYTHSSVKTPLVKELYPDNDVWVLDMRTSIGHPKTCLLPWTFEDIAFNDIPLAIQKVLEKTDEKFDKVNIVAHCIAAIMFSMTLLSSQDSTVDTAYPDALKNVHKVVNRIVLSQVGPLIMMKQGNVLRGYLASYFRFLLPEVEYRFNPEKENELMVLWDRMLNLLPYPDENFVYENPTKYNARAEFVKVRRRMDALYGRVFNIKNMSEEFLEKIEDIYDSANIFTVTQMMHNSRLSRTCDKNGRPRYVTQENCAKNWANKPTFLLHGRNNHIFDVKTHHINKAFLGQFTQVEGCVLENTEHQDCIMGNHKQKDIGFKKIRKFLGS